MCLEANNHFICRHSMCPASGPSPTASADVHWAQAPRRAITDPLRCQADMEQLLAAAGPEQSPPCVRVTANPPRTNTPQLAQLAVPQRRDLLEQLLHLTMLRAIFTAPSQSPDSSRFSSAIAPLLCQVASQLSTRRTRPVCLSCACNTGQQKNASGREATDSSLQVKRLSVNLTRRGRDRIRF